MVSKETPQAKEWFDEAARRLTSLCKKFAARAEDFEVLPTSEQIKSAMALMKQVQHSHAPKISTTDNTEIALLWESTGDKFKAYVQTDGSVICFRNKTQVSPDAFIDNIARVPA